MAQSSNWLNSVVANPWFGIISLMIRFTGLILLVMILVMCISLIVRLIDIIYNSKYYIVSKPKYFKDFVSKSWID